MVSYLMLLSKRAPGVIATIYTVQISKQPTLDIQRHNAHISRYVEAVYA